MNKRILIGIMTLVMMGLLVGTSIAFDPVMSYPHTVVSIGDNHFMINYVEDGTIVSVDPLIIEWEKMWILTPIFNNETAVPIVFHDDNRITINGNGICLDDGSSTDGGRCNNKLTALNR